MSIENNTAGKKTFVEPRVEILEVQDTGTGPFPDPSEFPTILQQIS